MVEYSSGKLRKEHEAGTLSSFSPIREGAGRVTLLRNRAQLIKEQ